MPGADSNGTWCIVRDADKTARVLKKGGDEENAYAGNEISRTSNEISRAERTHAGFTGRGMSSLLVQEILAAAGQPVKAHTLNVQEMEQAVNEGRVLQVYYWSNFGEGEASFGFATDFGVDGDGRVHPSYLVFPDPSRRRSVVRANLIGKKPMKCLQLLALIVSKPVSR